MIGLIRNLALLHDNHMALKENGLIPILVQLMNKAYQDSNTRHVAPAGYMVSIFLCMSQDILVIHMYVWFRGGMVNIKVVECLICSFKGLFILPYHHLISVPSNNAMHDPEKIHNVYNLLSQNEACMYQ